MLKRFGGFTLIELMIVVAIVAILGSVVTQGLFATRGATETEAKTRLGEFLVANGIGADQIKRQGCAGDSDGDGYGSRTVVLKDGEKINLQCPVGLGARWSGATGCKEVDLIMR